MIWSILYGIIIVFDILLQVINCCIVFNTNTNGGSVSNCNHIHRNKRQSIMADLDEIPNLTESSGEDGSDNEDNEKGNFQRHQN